MCDAEAFPPRTGSEGSITGDPEVVAALLEGWLAYDWEGRAAPHQLSVQTLMIVGELGDPDREAEAVAKAMPNASAVTMPRVGHIGVQLAVDESIAHAHPFLTGFTSSQHT
jgi:hypothetical protein